MPNNVTSAKQRIGFVGVNFVTKHLLNELTKNYEIIAWNSTRTDQPFSKKIKFIQVDISWSAINHWHSKNGTERSLPYYFKKLIPSLWKEKPDVVIVMDFIKLWFLQALLYSLFHPHTKLVIHSETKRTPPSPLSALFFYILLGIIFIFQWRVSAILTYSIAGKEYLARRLPFSNIHHFAPPIEEGIPHHDEMTPGETIRILVPARLIPFKRHFDIIKAAEGLDDSKNIVVDFVSFKPNNSFYEPEIRKMLAQSSAKINILPDIETPFGNYYSLLKNYDVVLLASTSEGFGSVIPAALHAGRAVIVSDGIPTSEIVQKYDIGYIFPAHDYDTLTQILNQLDKDELKIKGQKAFTCMNNNFTPESSVKHLEEILKIGNKL